MSILRKKQQVPARRHSSRNGREGRALPSDLDERYTFRRNRTLTGSLSSGVSSVNEHRAELKSARIQSHDLRKHRRRLLWVFLLVGAVAASLAWLIFQSIAVPHVVTYGTTQPVDSKMYEAKIQQYLNGHFLERSRATLSVAHLTEYLQENGCPEIAAVSPDMHFVGLGASELTVMMRRPAVGWKTGASQLFVDLEGNAFVRNYYPSPTVEVVDQTGIQAANNQVLASNRFLGFIGRTIGRFKQEGLTVTKVVLPAATTHQIIVSVSEASTSVKLSVDRPAGEQAEDAARALRYLAAKEIAAEYVDVRISGKAYYR